MSISRLQKHIKQRWLKRRPVEIEPQEIFLDTLVLQKEKKTSLRELKFEVPPSQKTLRVFLIFSLAGFFILFAKTFQLAVMENKNFAQLSLRNSQRLSPIKQDRGVIYDSNFKKLVTNLPSFDLVLDKRDLPRDENQKYKAIETVSQIVKKDILEIEKEIKETSQETLLVAENLDQETLVILETKMGDLPGFQIQNNTVRNYLEGIFFSHVLGYTGRINPQEFQSLKREGYFISDYLGKQGLEKSYEKTLRGEPGIIETEKDTSGKKIKTAVRSEPKPGKSLVLRLDSGLQEKLQTELIKITNEIGNKKAAAVAIDPKTGGVLALVSLPSFDNNLFAKGDSPDKLEQVLKDPREPLFNRAVSGLYASGSTIKPLIASAALEEQIISPEKQIFDQGFIEVKNQYNPDITYIFHDLKSHGWVDLKKAIAESCNVYFYTIGGGYKGQKGLGLSRIKKYLELFNWGKITGIDLPGESAGLIPDNVWKKEKIGENWYLGDTYNLSIGQGYLQITPLQEAISFAAIANGGKIFRPQIVAKIIEGTKDNYKTIEEFKPVVIRELPIEEKNLEIVREGMRDAVIYGSSAILNSLPVKAAAKTGTAQTPRENYYYNWVTVFAPYENPEIVLVVMIEDVPGVRAAALPVAHEVLKWYFSPTSY